MATTRFAPSPTGYLHIGGARTALFDLLWAKKTGGSFILRIEDTDQSRNSPTAAAQVMDDLKWLGLNWDKGPLVGGDSEPYYQSQRKHIYDKYLAELLEQKKAYYCFDSAGQLNQMRDEAIAAKKNFIYPRPKPEIFPTAAQAEQAKAQGKDVIVRFCMPDGEIVVKDQIRGQVKFDADQISDPVIQKSDGFPTYHFACVVDDELMGIDCVIRGQEHLMNTPCHIALQEALGFKTPLYAHISVTVSETGGKMSKRERWKTLQKAIKANKDLDIAQIASAGSVSTQELEQFLKGKSTPDSPQVDGMAEFLNIALPEINIVDFFRSGYLPEALVNFIALLGYSPAAGKEILTLDELIETFDAKRFNKTNSLFDRKKLLAFNTEHIKMCSEEKLLSHYKKFLKGINSIAAGADDKLLARILKSSAGARTLADVEHKSRFVFTKCGDLQYDDKDVSKVLLKNEAQGLAMLEELKGHLQKLEVVSEQSIEKLLRQLAEEKQLGLGKIAQPLRVAICGTTVSLPIFDAIDILGINETIKRLDNTISKFKH